MRNGHLRETVDGKVYNSFTGWEVRWDFDMGQWVAVPEPTEGTTVYIASNPNGTYRELGKLNVIEWGPVVGDDEEAWRLANPGLKDIRTDKTDTFTVTFRDAEETAAALGYPTSTAAWPVDMKAWDDALRRERESRQANRQRWFTPKKEKWPQLTERQMSPSVYTPQPEDPLFTSEEIERAAQHLGVELTPWQEELLGQASKSSLIMASFPRRNGKTNVTKVANKLAEWQGATAGRPIYDEACYPDFAYGTEPRKTPQEVIDELDPRRLLETSTEAKKLSKKERIAELEQEVSILLTSNSKWEADNENLGRDLEDAREWEGRHDTQLEINHTLKTRITNQRTELRRLNESLRTKSLEAKMLGLRVKILGKEKGHLVGSSESKQRTIESQQEIIDGLRAQLAKKPWWRS